MYVYQEDPRGQEEQEEMFDREGRRETMRGERRNEANESKVRYC